MSTGLLPLPGASLCDCMQQARTLRPTRRLVCSSPPGWQASALPWKGSVWPRGAWYTCNRPYDLGFRV